METGDKCSYLLSVDSFAQGDMIELSAIDSNKINLQLYHGGYSLSSSQHQTHLENGKRYLIDGSQKLFLMVETVYTPSQGKPYFSLAMKKVKDSSFVEESETMATLMDASILEQMVSYDPITGSKTT